MHKHRSLDSQFNYLIMTDAFSLWAIFGIDFTKPEFFSAHNIMCKADKIEE